MEKNAKAYQRLLARNQIASRRGWKLSDEGTLGPAIRPNHAPYIHIWVAIM